ncbi:MAG TPA: hypothetical protein VGD98_09690 [Ktedonobacteraceae bacterium]
MFKPHRFNPLLKAVPNAGHEAKVSSKLVHGHTHEELLEETKQTTTVAQGQVQTTTETVVADVKTSETPTSHGKVRKKTEVEASVEAVTTTKPVSKKAGGNGDEDDAGGTTEILSRVHATTEGIAAVEMTPPHPPREETPEYVKAHHHLVYELDEPCAMCGVKHSTLKDPAQNPFGAAALETHHYPIERSLLDACDPAKVGLVFPQVKDVASLNDFVDSENNLMVLCDIHHRHPLHGIHHLTPQDFFVQPFLLAGYQVVTTQQDAAAVMAADEALVDKIIGNNKH